MILHKENVWKKASREKKWIKKTNGYLNYHMKKPHIPKHKPLFPKKKAERRLNWFNWDSYMYASLWRYHLRVCSKLNNLGYRPTDKTHHLWLPPNGFTFSCECIRVPSFFLRHISNGVGTKMGRQWKRTEKIGISRKLGWKLGVWSLGGGAGGGTKPCSSDDTTSTAAAAFPRFPIPADQ